MTGELPVLYSFRRCPYAMRARLALHASGQCCELREIVLRDKAAEFLAASPKGTVPVLVTAQGDVVEESLDIMLWALGRSDPERWLMPETGDLDAMLALITVCDGDFKSQLDAYKYAGRDNQEAAQSARSAGSQFLQSLNVTLERQPYLFGGRISLGDMAIMPFVRQFAHVDRAWFDSEPWTALRQWLDLHLSSLRFAAVMTKYAKWQAGDEPVIFGG